MFINHQPPGTKRWAVFIVSHKNIFSWLYAQDPGFNLYNYRFVHISPNPLKQTNAINYRVIDLPHLPGFIRIGDYYVETEAIYNVYKKPEIYAGLDYIGFLHYDFELRSFDGSTDITAQINRYLQDKSKAHISLTTNNAIAVYNQMILADETQPNALCGPGYNCLDYILRDYNQFFHTNYGMDEVFRRQHINMCSSFLIDRNTFLKMMGFIAWVIESGKLNVFDTQHHLKIHGHFLERYFAIFLVLEYEHFLNLTLTHHGNLKMAN